MKASKPYFSHDIAAKNDEKIIRLIFDFRKNKKDFSESTLQELVSHAAYAIYWEIIEYMHENTLKVDELEMLSDTLRVDVEILEKILNDYELFKIKDGAYISERVLRNLKLQEEKSEKARQSANKRHSRTKKDEETPQSQDKPETKADDLSDYNEEFVMSIIQIYNEKFKKSQIVSKENKQRIFLINKNNNLALETWNKIFSNAKRGWDIGDKKNVPPNLKKILDEWDSFASDDYFLAPDREALAKQKEVESAIAEQKNKEQRLKDEEFNKKRAIAEAAICDKESVFNYLLQYSPSISKLGINFLVQNSTLKKLAKKYNFTIQEFIEYRDAHFANSDTNSEGINE